MKNECVALNLKLFLGLFIIYFALLPVSWLVFLFEISLNVRKNPKKRYIAKTKSSVGIEIGFRGSFCNTRKIPNCRYVNSVMASSYNNKYEIAKNQKVFKTNKKCGRRVNRRYQLLQKIDGTKLMLSHN